MKYINEHDAIYTAAGIMAVGIFMAILGLFSYLGLVGDILTILMVCGTGAVLGQAIQTWHIDFKFSQELDGFEEHLREALHLKKNETIQ